MLCQVLEEASAESVYTDAVMVNSLGKSPLARMAVPI